MPKKTSSALKKTTPAKPTAATRTNRAATGNVAPRLITPSQSQFTVTSRTTPAPASVPPFANAGQQLVEYGRDLYNRLTGAATTPSSQPVNLDLARPGAPRAITGATPPAWRAVNPFADAKRYVLGEVARAAPALSVAYNAFNPALAYAQQRRPDPRTPLQLGMPSSGNFRRKPLPVNYEFADMPALDDAQGYAYPQGYGAGELPAYTGPVDWGAWPEPVYSGGGGGGGGGWQDWNNETPPWWYGATTWRF